MVLIVSRLTPIFENELSDHMGSLDFYTKHGFVLHEEAGKKIVMKKQL